MKVTLLLRGLGTFGIGILGCCLLLNAVTMGVALSVHAGSLNSSFWEVAIAFALILLGGSLFLKLCVQNFREIAIEWNQRSIRRGPTVEDRLDELERLKRRDLVTLE